MATRRLLRFSLASLLGLITLLAAALGYTKWNLEQSQRRVEQLKAAGVMVSAASRNASWLEYVATGEKDVRLARQMTLSVRIFDDGYLIGDRLPFAEQHLSQARMLPKVKDLVDEISALGVPQFYIRVLGDHRDESLERELKRTTGAPVEWLPPAVAEYGDF